MTDNNQDIFNKIDVILGKRDVEVLAEKVLATEDFPMLTEVIVGEGDGESSYAGLERRGVDIQSPGRRLIDGQNDVTESIADVGSGTPVTKEELASLLSSMERRLTDLLMEQHVKLESLLSRNTQESVILDKPDEV